MLAIIDFRKMRRKGRPWSSAELAQAGFSLQARHDFLPQQIFLVYGVK